MDDRQYPFIFTNPQNWHMETFKAQCPLIISDCDEPHDESGQRDINVMLMGNVDNATSINRRGTVELPFQYVCPSRDLTRTDSDHVVGIGERMPPLAEWARHLRESECWEYWPRFNVFNMVFKGAAGEVRKVGRWVGAELFKRHEQGNHLGYFLHNTYVGEYGLSFSKIGEPKIGEPEGGIKEDLGYFKEFVEALLHRHPIKKDRAHSNEDYEKVKAVVQSTLDLCDYAKTAPDADLLSVSYFITHTPLFWEQDQRRDFCYAAYQLGKRRSKAGLWKILDSVPEDWNKRVEYDLGTQYKMVMNDTYLKEDSGGIGLLHYHRGCHIHLRKAEKRWNMMSSYKTIDDKLHWKFPDIIPRAWYEMCTTEKLQDVSRSDLVAELRNQPGMLDYVKL